MWDGEVKYSTLLVSRRDWESIPRSPSIGPNGRATALKDFFDDPKPLEDVLALRHFFACTVFDIASGWNHVPVMGRTHVG
mmetsp:Transcript_100200/g.287876  ORF Transcript_100200/g.287876 Transcript_100200/m.287876 type:complete len:80 (-) Transcript_100200:8-247(-)